MALSLDRQIADRHIARYIIRLRVPEFELYTIKEEAGEDSYITGDQPVGVLATGFTEPMVRVMTQSGVAIFARIKSLTGSMNYLVFTQKGLIVGRPDCVLHIGHSRFNTKNYFERLRRGEPCGEIVDRYIGHPALPPQLRRAQHYEFVERARLVHKPTSSFFKKCCRFLCGSEPVSAVTLLKA